MKLTKNRIGAVAGAALLTIAAFIIWLIQPLPQTFDSHTWKTCHNHTVRLSMVDDLQKRYKLVKMTKQQVFELLGTPDDASKSGTSATWDMGTKPGLDDCTFSVKFDRYDKVVSVSDDER